MIVHAAFQEVETQLSAFKNALLTGQHPFPLVSAAHNAETHGGSFQSTDRSKSDASTVPGATPQGATSVSVNAPPFAPPFSTYTEHPYTSWTPPPPPPEQGDKTGAFLSQLREGSDG